MSKAFTSEETPDEPVLGRPVQRAPRGQERPMTPEGYQALLAEEKRLGSGLTQELKHRLALVRATLESVRVVSPPPPDGTVRFGSTVTLEWDDGRVQRLRLVGPDETEAEPGAAERRARQTEAKRTSGRGGATQQEEGTDISVESPLARTLLEQKEGDEVEVTRPRGVATARLLRVE